uniref:Heavy metal-associated isoprenylated plant protein 43-like isoform X2 n=1 Tax=Elaeis guineensis var. tenera TaxID=51953 RepID=A0A8N4I663_ELAGV|nr:heavy metal-associated isoprenylated plant protein 43-like isoform X2 [Elaeis guineensis]
MKIVLKISIFCLKCKTCVMRTVAKVEGVNEIKVDVEKGTLTVIGDADPVTIVEKLRKIRKAVAIVSVGENTEPEAKHEPKPKPEPEPELNPCRPLPHCCRSCQPVAIGYVSYDDWNLCSIL